jgi:hypothetical protein
VPSFMQAMKSNLRGWELAGKIGIFMFSVSRPVSRHVPSRPEISRLPGTPVNTSVAESRAYELIK